ncbi:MAG: carboxypeptidase-like regulatory domain-containing protein [Prevotella sp.]|nr:carboxypeptidase-like regulatory domain-containing protein [Prevotella sp.]
MKGRVLDVNGEPIIGASVIVKGTSQGAVTDLDGNFSIVGIDQSAYLVT